MVTSVMTFWTAVVNHSAPPLTYVMVLQVAATPQGALIRESLWSEIVDV